MNLKEQNPPRKFRVGLKNQFEISDCGCIRLNSDEQVTFMTERGREYDVTAKPWGFYATPSVNGRLKRFGFKTALVRNSKGQYYVMIVEPEKIDAFNEYIKEEKQTVVEWLDEKSG